MKSCNFCGRTEEQVKLIITSPKADICAGCALICMEILINNLTEYKEVSFEGCKGDIGVRFINNPFDIVIQAVKELYPDTQALIQFNPNLRGKEYRECGRTIFPDDGGIPLIDISTNIPFEAMVEILAHEIAHVVVGPDVEPEEEHGKKWEEVFEAIHKKYMELAGVVEAQEQ
ncbi:MAG: ClpX C4-type zinc finger protein [Moorellaceae bacterium]